MKKLFLTILIALFAAPLYAYTVLNTATGLIEESNEMPEISRTVERLVNGTKVTYQIDKVLLNPDPIIEGAYYPSLPGFGQISEEATPWLPARIDRFPVSDANSASFQILEQQTMTTTLQVSPGRTSHTALENFNYTADNLPSITPSSSFVPADAVFSNGCLIYRGNAFLGIYVAPIQYISNTKTMRVYKKLSYIVEDSGNSPAFEDSHNTPVIQSLVNTACDSESPQPRANGRYSRPEPISYLIITHDKVYNSANEFFYTKKRRGYDMKMVSASSWTPDQIRAAVKKFYDEDPDNAAYVVLFGDHNLIPAEPFTDMSNSGNTLYSDMKYFCMDGENDNLPDLFYGRIPVAEDSEGYNVLKKIRAYEENPNNDSDVTRFCGASYFEDGTFDEETQTGTNNDGVEDQDFVRTVETVLQNVEDIFDEVGRVYYKKSPITPDRWVNNNDLFPLPDFLKNDDMWNGNADDIVKAFNDGTTMFLHSDHGEYKCWSNPWFEIRHIPNLNNCIYPLVFSMNCQSGNFDRDETFSKELLKRKDGGAATIIGSVTKSYCEPNDVLTLAMMNSIWPDKTFPYYKYPSTLLPYRGDAVYTIGQALAIGLDKMEDAFMPPHRYGYSSLMHHQRLTYHILGDPSLYIYWGADYGIEDNISISYDADSYSMDIQIHNGVDCYISYWDTTFGTNKRVKGTRLTADYVSPETYIYIYRNGMKPICGYIGYDNLPSLTNNLLTQSYVKNVKLNGNELSIDIENNNTSNLSVIVNESTNISSVSVNTYENVGENVTHSIQNPNTRYFFIKLLKGNEVVEYKSILKTY